MTSRPSGQWLLATALSAGFLVASCTGTSHSNSGPDSGAEDSGSPAAICGSIGASCPGGAGDCCTNLSCQSGICASHAPLCAGYGEPCDAQVLCCNPPGATVDGGRNPLSCVTLDAGLSVCLMGQQGSACTSDTMCASPFTCQAAGYCDFPISGNACGSPPCFAGDDCSSSFNAIQSRGTIADPCTPSGLVCDYGGNIAGTSIMRCVVPGVAEPPTIYTGGDPFDPTICRQTKSSCASSSLDAPRTDPACGTNFHSQDGHCYQSCTTGDDCDSFIDDCVEGTCKPNYCFADGPNIFAKNPADAGTLAEYLGPFQVRNGGLPISSDPGVLFNPCLDAGFPTACLPGYDYAFNTAAGYCSRVGGAGNGGWGSVCDPHPYRNNLAGLCAPGTWCEKGTCMPWCDLGSTTAIRCPTGTTCNVVSGSSPIVSSALGADHSIGVCSEACDPYLPSAENGCQPFATDAGQAPLSCKFSESGSDDSPPAGMCVAAIDKPVGVGQGCSPFGWLDPCVSGSQCVFASLDGGGTAYVCAQLCDPKPSAGVTEPGCSAGTSCIPFPNCGGIPCSHQGACQ